MRCNLGDLLRRRADISPDLEAIVDLAADRRFTYRELNERINALAHALAAQGVQKGDRVALLMFNGIEFVDCLYAAAKLGAVAVPLNWRLVADELSSFSRIAARKLWSSAPNSPRRLPIFTAAAATQM